MTPNSYQQQVLDDLRAFLVRWQACDDAVLAYRAHWDAKGASGMPGYRPLPHGAPQVCAKVPTAGGKTLIGLCALKEIFAALERRRGDARFCLWLVPSLSIQEQVLVALRTPGDPYLQTLQSHFEGRATVLDKSGLLAGGSAFSPDAVRDGLVMAVLTYDSLRAKNKDDRKLYQENAAMAPFASLPKASKVDIDPDSLVAVMAGLNPVVVVDESHNATTPLSLEMLANLNPSFVLELTATPREGANIISFIDAMALRDQHMVKLPVIVRNLPDRDAVIAHAIDLRARLEAEAEAEQAEGGLPIRPIVLFQAESKGNDERMTFTKVKSELIERGIPEEQIHIKTADINELKGIDLSARDCQVRYILTVNALKEGWNCPFAYILATLADRSSPVEVEQILGRILRQPYVRPHGREPLNQSYVLTASAVFSETLERIVAGLNRAGFSRNDYRTPDLADVTLEQSLASLPTASPQTAPLFDRPTSSIAGQASAGNMDTNAPVDSVEVTLACGRQAATELDAAQQRLAGHYLSPELNDKMDKAYPLRHEFVDEIAQLKIPQFFRKAPEGLLFADDGWVLLERENLLGREFRLANCDINDFTLLPVAGDVAKIDLLRIGTEGIEDYEPTRIRLKEQEIRALREYLATLSPDAKRQQLIGLVSNWIGKMPPLNEPDIRAYIEKILATLTPAQLEEVVEHQHAYVDGIRKRVRLEMLTWSLGQMERWVRKDLVVAKPNFSLPPENRPRRPYPPSGNSLYQREDSGNNLENRMADFLAECENVRWWHRNDQNHGFFLNGATNHYPDFIVRMQSGRVVLVETKGDDRDNSDSKVKVQLGRLWQESAGREFRYLMVFESNAVEGARNWVDATDELKSI